MQCGRDELKELIRQSYEMVAAKAPRVEGGSKYGHEEADCFQSARFGRRSEEGVKFAPWIELAGRSARPHGTSHTSCR